MSVLCAICGSSRKVENAHIEPKKMGGRGPKAPADAHDTIPLCAIHTTGAGGNTDPLSCHGANEAGYLAIKADRWMLTASAPAALRRRLHTRDGLWHPYAYLGTDPDAVDIPKEAPHDPHPDMAAGGSERPAAESPLDRKAELLARFESILEAKESADYFLAVLTHDLRALGLTAAEVRDEVAEWLGDSMRSPLTSDPQVTRYSFWGSFGDSPGVRALGVARAYKLRSVPFGWREDADRAADVSDPTYNWQTFDADYIGEKPLVERGEKCVCPTCGCLHQKKGGKE